MSENTPPPDDGTEFIAAASDGAYTLVVADFADTATAWTAYEALEAAEDGRTVEIEGVVVVKRDADGKLEVQKATDHSTKSGLKWGLVGGIALGVIFPPSILGSAAALGAAGAATGKVRQLHHRSELADELEDSIAPGHSGILALVSDPARWRSARRLPLADAIVERPRSTTSLPATSRPRPRRPRPRTSRSRPPRSDGSPTRSRLELVGAGARAAARSACRTRRRHRSPAGGGDGDRRRAGGQHFPWRPCGAGGSGPAWWASWRRRRCSSAPCSPSGRPSRWRASSSSPRSPPTSASRGHPSCWR